MTWKAGDQVSLPVYLESLGGVAQTFTAASVFLAMGGALTFYQGGAPLASPPSWTLAPEASGVPGWHAVSFVLPYGVTSALLTLPASLRSDPGGWLLVVPTNDTDSLAANQAVPVPAGTNFQTQDMTTIEGDAFSVTFTIPATDLVVYDPTIGSYQFNDLSDINGTSWTVAAQARGPWPSGQLPTNPVAFSYSASVTNKTGCQITIGWSTAPAGAVVVNQADGSADTTGASPQTQYLFDVQLETPSGCAYGVRKITVVVGSHFIKRQQTTTP